MHATNFCNSFVLLQKFYNATKNCMTLDVLFDFYNP